MRSTVNVVLSSLAFALVVAAPLTAHAQDDGQGPPPQQMAPYPPPPPQSAQAPNGEWVAPLSQQTQPTYVPQSVAMSGPRQLSDWEEGEPIPHGYHPVTRTRKGMIIAGSVTFGTMYLITLLVAAAGADVARADGTSNQYGALWIPGVGPFIQMGNTSTSSGNLVLAIDGAAQCAGLAMLIYGISSPRTVLVRDDLAKPMVTPMRVGQDGYGLGVIGTF